MTNKINWQTAASTNDAGSPAAAGADGSMHITSGTGRSGALPTSTTSSCCAATTTDCSTNKAGASRVIPTVTSPGSGPTASPTPPPFSKKTSPCPPGTHSTKPARPPNPSTRHRANQLLGMT